MEAVVIAVCLLALFCAAGYLTLDLASQEIAGAFRDALNALDEFLP